MSERVAEKSAYKYACKDMHRNSTERERMETGLVHKRFSHSPLYVNEVEEARRVNQNKCDKIPSH